MYSSTNPPSCVYFSNVWLPVCRAGEDRYVWVNTGIGFYKTGLTAGQREKEARFSR